MVARALPPPFLHASQHDPIAGTDPLNKYEKRRNEIIEAAMGIKGGNYPREFANTGGVNLPATQRLSVVPMAFLAGEVVTELMVASSAAGVGVTLCKMALFDVAANPNLLRASSDNSGVMGSVGLKIFTLTTPYTFAADAAVLGAYLAVAGTSTPGLDRIQSTNGGANGKIAGASVGKAGSMGAQTDIPGTLTVSWDGNGMTFWIGWR